MEEVMRLVRDESMNAIPPFDDPRIIAGQGTMGLEIVKDLPELDTVLVPLSGGGLAAGVAAAVKAKRPLARVIEFPCAARRCKRALKRANQSMLRNRIRWQIPRWWHRPR